MKVTELLVESYDTSKHRIEHPEDLVLTNGSSGASLALNLLKQAVDNPASVSVKPDGRPAIKWGRDLGGFAMGDKYMNPLPHSIQELTKILLSRKGGGREDLVMMYTKLWPIFEASVPSINGYLFGDLMYSSTPVARGGAFHLKPNTVDYVVSTNSDLGQHISKSQAGIVVHTYLPMDSTIGKHITDLGAVPGIRPIGNLLMISDQLPRGTSIALPNMNKTVSIIRQYSSAIDSFLDSAQLSSKKITGITQLLKKFANDRVRQRDFSNMADGFLNWIETNTNQTMAANIKQHIQENLQGYKAMWVLFESIAMIKNSIVSQLDKRPGEMTASINGETGHEGYLVHSNKGPIKLVNRFKFSAANFGV